MTENVVTECSRCPEFRDTGNENEGEVLEVSGFYGHLEQKGG